MTAAHCTPKCTITIIIRIANGKIVVRPPTNTICLLPIAISTRCLSNRQIPISTNTQGFLIFIIWWQAHEKGLSSAEGEMQQKWKNCNSPCLFKCMIKLFDIPESICSISSGNKIYPTPSSDQRPSVQMSDKVKNIKISPTRFFYRLDISIFVGPYFIVK